MTNHQIDNVEYVVAAIFTAARIQRETYIKDYKTYWEEFYRCLDAKVAHEKYRAESFRDSLADSIDDSDEHVS